MPISGNASYIPTMNDFLAHWSEVNAALPALQPLVLKTAVARADLLALRGDLSSLMDDVQDKLNTVEIARGTLDDQKAALLARLNEFNGVMEASFNGTPIGKARPLAPNITDSEEKFVSPMRDMKSLWVKVNAAAAPPGLTLPLLLDGGMTQAQFVTALGNLQTAYADLSEAEQNLKLSRLTRDAKQGVIYENLKLYRLAVPARLPNNQTLIDSLPDLTPAPGHTPQPVNASAVFVAPDHAHVVYDASTDADLARYELRGNAGATFHSADAVVIATNQPGDAREFTTGFGLTQPGAKVSLAVYVVLNTGNEAASAPMLVQRP